MINNKNIEILIEVLGQENKIIKDCISIEEFAQSTQLSKYINYKIDLFQIINHIKIELNTIKKFDSNITKKLADAYKKSTTFNGEGVNLYTHYNKRMGVFKELKRTAYGKTVVLKGEKTCIYHIAQANEGIPELGIINRLSPVARKLVSANVGDEVILKSGEYDVIAVANLKRHSGIELELNYDNFKEMQLYGYDLKKIFNSGDLVNFYYDIKQTCEESILKIFENYTQIDHCDFENEFGLEDIYSSSETIHQENTSSLSAQFYTNTTKSQEALIQESSDGLIIVEGVAGSGKTSVALGRAKVLHDRRYNKDEDYDDYYDLTTTVGFVLNSQLIEYLKETRNQLSLYEMEIFEYSRLRNQLRIIRDINPKNKFKRKNIKIRGYDCQMPWLFATDKAIAKKLSIKLQESVSTFPAIRTNLTESELGILQSIWNKAINLVNTRIKGFNTKRKQIFKIEGLYLKLQQIRNEISYLAHDAHTLWIKDPIKDHWVNFDNTHSGVKFLFEKVDDIAFLNTENDEFELLHQTDDQLNQIFQNINLYMNIDDKSEDLSTKTIEEIKHFLFNLKLYKKNAGKLLLVLPHEELMTDLLIKGELFYKSPYNEKWEKIHSTRNPFTSTNGRKINQSIQNALKNRFIKATNIIELYKEIITDGTFKLEIQTNGLNNDDINEVEKDILYANNRLKKNEISDSDIDIILSIAHLMSRGYKSRFETNPITCWGETSLYSHIFIDEVQDFTEIQVFLMSEQAKTKRRSITVTGDFNQQLNDGRITNLKRCFPYVPDEDSNTAYLSENKRQSYILSQFSNLFRKEILHDNRNETYESNLFKNDTLDFDSLSIKIFSAPAIPLQVKNIILEVPDTSSIAIICPTTKIAKKLEMELKTELNEVYRETQFSEHQNLCRPFYVHFTTPIMVKGLEFDNVIIPYFNIFNLNSLTGAQHAYVAITRATKKLYILGTNEINKNPFKQILDNFSSVTTNEFTDNNCDYVY